MENAIEFLKGQEKATVTFSSEKWRNRLRKLQKEHPSEVDIFTDDETYTCGHIPASWLKIHPPRNMTEEQRLELAERMRKLREVQDADG